MGHPWPARGVGRRKRTGITKEDIGVKLTIEEYNEACKKAVMRYTDIWNDLTRKMGYWVDMDAPYVTYENKYIESVWWCHNSTIKICSTRANHSAAACGRNRIEFTRVEPTRCVPRRQGHHGHSPFKALPECGARVLEHAGSEKAEAYGHLPSTSWHGRPRRGRSLQHGLTVGLNRYVHRSHQEPVHRRAGLVVLAEDLMGKHFGGKSAGTRGNARSAAPNCAARGTSNCSIGPNPWKA